MLSPAAISIATVPSRHDEGASWNFTALGAQHACAHCDDLPRCTKKVIRRN